MSKFLGTMSLWRLVFMLLNVQTGNGNVHELDDSTIV